MPRLRRFRGLQAAATLLVLLACREEGWAGIAAAGAPSAQYARAPWPLPPPARRSGQGVGTFSVFEEAQRAALVAGDAVLATAYLSDMAGQLNEAGFHSRARVVINDILKKAGGIADVRKRDDRINKVRQLALRAGDIEPAIAFLGSSTAVPVATVTKVGGAILWARTPGSLNREFLLQDVLDALVESGDRERARRLLQETGADEEARAQKMALALAASGRGLEALDLLKGVGKAGQSLILQLPRIQAAAGDIAGAVATSRAIEDDAARWEALQELACEQIKRNDPVGAVEMLHRELRPFPGARPAEFKIFGPVSPAQRAWVCVMTVVRDAAEKLAERGYPVEARLLLEKHGSLLHGLQPGDQAWVIGMASITLAHVARGEWEMARTASQEALASAEKIAGVERAVTFMYVGRALAAVGDLDGALARLESSAAGYTAAYRSMKDTYRGEVRAAYVWGRMMAGEGKKAGEALDAMLREADASAQDTVRGAAQSALIEHLLRAGRVDEALAQARSEQKPERKAWLLAGTAKTMLDLWPEPGQNR